MKYVRAKTGERYNFLTFISYNGNRKWIMRCDCGSIKTYFSHNVKVGSTRSCGCMKKTIIAKQQTVHGFTSKPKGSPERRTFDIWRGIFQRCYDKHHKSYPGYGGRGISVCDRWHEFKHFLGDMGLVPASKSIGRINNDGIYEPGNCAWQTRLEQANNCRTSRYYTVGGKCQTVAQWAREMNLKQSVLRYRLFKYGSSILLPPNAGCPT